jgi:hypothetical protein
MEIDRYRLMVMAIPLILILEIPRLVLGSFEGRTSHADHSPAAIGRGTLTAPQREFLLKEYDTAVREIRLRVDAEETLFALKFTMVGAVLAAMFYMHRREDETPAHPSFRSPWAATCCWAAVLVGAVIDIRRQFNVGVMVQLGTWVHWVEDLMLPSDVLGWEQFIPTSQLWSSTLYPLLRLERELVTWILYVVTLTMFVPNRDEQPDLLLLRLSRLFCCLSICLFGLNSLHYRYWDWRYGIYCLALVVVGCVITFRWMRILSAKSSPQAPELAAAA